MEKTTYRHHSVEPLTLIDPATFLPIVDKVQDLTFILSALLHSARQKAAAEPTPAHPPSAEASRAADLYVELIAVDGCLPPMTPEVATALIPRIVAALPRAEEIAQRLDAMLGDKATGGEVLRRLLLVEWHSDLRDKWMNGGA